MAKNTEIQSFNFGFSGVGLGAEDSFLTGFNFEWNGTAEYSEGAIAYNEGILYRALVNIGAPDFGELNVPPEIDGDSWEAIGGGGGSGANAGIRPWSATENDYVNGSLVVYNGQIFSNVTGQILIDSEADIIDLNEDGVRDSDGEGNAIHRHVNPEQDIANWDTFRTDVTYYTNYGDSEKADPASAMRFITEKVSNPDATIQGLEMVINGEYVRFNIGGSGGQNLQFTENHTVTATPNNVPQYSIQDAAETGMFRSVVSFSPAFLVAEVNSLGTPQGSPIPDTASTIEIVSVTPTITSRPNAASTADIVGGDINANDDEVYDIILDLDEQYMGSYVVSFDYEIIRTTENPNDTASPETFTGTMSTTITISAGTYASVARNFTPRSATQFGSDGETDAIDVIFDGTVSNGVITIAAAQDDFAVSQNGGTAITTSGFSADTTTFDFMIEDVNTYVNNDLSVTWGLTCTSTGNFTGTPDRVFTGVRDTMPIANTAVSFGITGMPPAAGTLDPFDLTQNFTVSLSDTNLDHRNGDQSGPYDNGASASPISLTRDGTEITPTAFILNSDSATTSYASTYEDYTGPIAATANVINNWLYSYTDTRNTTKSSTRGGTFTLGVHGYLVHTTLEGNGDAFFQSIIDNAHTGIAFPASSFNAGSYSWSGSGSQFAGRTTYLVLPSGVTGPSRVLMRVGATEVSQNVPAVGGILTKTGGVIFNNTNGNPFEFDYQVYLIYTYPSSLSAAQTVNGSLS